MSFPQLKTFVTKAVAGIVLIGLGVIGTYAVMTIQHLRADNEVLEQRLDELKVQKVILESVQSQLQEQNKALENSPLK